MHFTSCMCLHGSKSNAATISLHKWAHLLGFSMTDSKQTASHQTTAALGLWFSKKCHFNQLSLLEWAEQARRNRLQIYRTPMSQNIMASHWWSNYVDYLVTTAHFKVWDILDGKWTVGSRSQHVWKFEFYLSEASLSECPNLLKRIKHENKNKL